MVTVVNVQEAKTRLSQLLRLVEAGEEILIARSGHVIVRLQAVDAMRRSFDEPLLAGLDPVDASPLIDPLGEDERADWEGASSDDPLFESYR